jgi:catechol 2,3-dioxygenase-like lactoylglutathione lyase family enzyme
MQTVTVRYIVDDVDAAVAFYDGLLGFEVAAHPAPGFAMLFRGELRLLLNAPGAGGAGTADRTGAIPQPGGWNRIQLPVEDIAAEVERLKQAGAVLRTDIVHGNGGKQVLVEDPAGNLVELLEPR